MPAIPAFCEDCGTAFPSPFNFSSGERISFKGNRCGPCPKCGGIGDVIDGIFNFSEALIEIVSAPTWTHERLDRLASKLRAIKRTDLDIDEKISEIEKENPELRKLTDALPRTRKELYSFAGLLLATIMAIKSCVPVGSSTADVVQELSAEEVSFMTMDGILDGK